MEENKVLDTVTENTEEIKEGVEDILENLPTNNLGTGAKVLMVAGAAATTYVAGKYVVLPVAKWIGKETKELYIKIFKKNKNVFDAEVENETEIKE